MINNNYNLIIYFIINKIFFFIHYSKVMNLGRL